MRFSTSAFGLHIATDQIVSVGPTRPRQGGVHEVFVTDSSADHHIVLRAVDCETAAKAADTSVRLLSTTEENIDLRTKTWTREVADV